ncbi:unnamed protein product [Durusdinium trenchii]|uniref:Uncharacterized protein n=2 Tax=Durusdinium trenchii TaxID=1381693 RepID=A0ABP0IWF2_9DINO
MVDLTLPALELPWELPPPPEAPPGVSFNVATASGQSQFTSSQSNPFQEDLEPLTLDVPPPKPPPALTSERCAGQDCERFRPCSTIWQGVREKDKDRKKQSPSSEGRQNQTSHTEGVERVGNLEGVHVSVMPTTEFERVDSWPPRPSLAKMEDVVFHDWQLQAKEALINETLDDITFVQESFEAAEKDLEWRKATTASKRQQIETRQAELSVFQKRVMQQEQEVVADEEQLLCREAQLDSDAQHLKRCENALKVEAKRVQQRREDLSHSEPMLRKKEEELAKMQEELSILEKEVFEAEQDIQHRSADIAAAEAQLRRRRAELSSRQAEVSEDRRALQTRQAEIQQVVQATPAPPAPAQAQSSMPVQQANLMPHEAARTHYQAEAVQIPAPCVQMPSASLQPPVQAPFIAPVAPPIPMPMPMPAPAVDPVQQNLALQLQQTQQMLQMQQMQQLQHFLKGGSGSDEESKGKSKETQEMMQRHSKLQALEESLVARLQILEKQEASLNAVMGAAAQAAKETQEATAAIVSQSTQAAKDTAAAMMAQSSETLKLAMRDMTESLAAREQEALDAMKVKRRPKNQVPLKPKPPQAQQQHMLDAKSEALAAVVDSLEHNDDIGSSLGRKHEEQQSAQEDEGTNIEEPKNDPQDLKSDASQPMDPSGSPLGTPADRSVKFCQSDIEEEQAGEGASKPQVQGGGNVGVPPVKGSALQEMRNAARTAARTACLESTHGAERCSIPTRKAALRPGWGGEDAEAVARAAALVRGEPFTVESGEYWQAGDDAMSLDEDEDNVTSTGHAGPVTSTQYGGEEVEGMSTEGEESEVSEGMELHEQLHELSITRSSVVEQSHREVHRGKRNDQAFHQTSASPSHAWEIDLSDWPRMPSQKLKGASMAEAGRRRMQIAQKAAARSVESPRVKKVQAPVLTATAKAKSCSIKSSEGRASKGLKGKLPVRAGRAEAWEIDATELTGRKVTSKASKTSLGTQDKADTVVQSNQSSQRLGSLSSEMRRASRQSGPTAERRASGSSARSSRLHLCDAAADPDG